MRLRRRYVYTFIMLFLCVLAQSTFLEHFRIYGIKPDPALLIVVMLGLYNSMEEGIIFGLLTGIFCSFFSAASSFWFCLSYGAAGFIGGMVKDRVYPDPFVVPSLTALGCALLCSGILLVPAIIAGNRDMESLLPHLLTFLIINTLPAIPAGFLIRSPILTSRRAFE